MLIHNESSFLSGDEPFFSTNTIEVRDNELHQELVFEPRHEGFIGIPHGGLGMGLCLDAWLRSGATRPPVTVDYKFGGSGVKIGDSVDFDVQRPEEGRPRLLASLTKKGDKTPYLRADIRPASDGEMNAQVPEPPGSDFRKLPYYRNCFVCGHHRTEPGLQRRFRVHDPSGQKITSVEWGSESDDRDRAERFLIGKEELHPAVLTSIFDENTAWAGFMLTRSGALSVRLSLTILRPVKLGEPLLFLGMPTKTRGNPKSPRFFLAEGSILSMEDPGRPEPVAYGAGEWIIRKEYTQQIKQNLLPPDDWEWVFEPQ